MARRRRVGRRPHAACRLAITDDAPAVRLECRDRAGGSVPSQAQPRRSAMRPDVPEEHPAVLAIAVPFLERRDGSRAGWTKVKDASWYQRESWRFDRR